MERRWFPSTLVHPPAHTRGSQVLAATSIALQANRVPLPRGPGFGEACYQRQAATHTHAHTHTCVHTPSLPHGSASEKMQEQEDCLEVPKGQSGSAGEGRQEAPH